jgi:putative ABC transport system permease protein
VLQKIAYNLEIALDAITTRKLRSFLTSLGLIFGVASVIAMLAIGRGAEQEVLAQIKLLGANNVIVRPLFEEGEGEQGPSGGEEESRNAPGAAQKPPFSPGLTLADARSIEEGVPGVGRVSPEIVATVEAVRAGLRRPAKLVGVERGFFEGGRTTLEQGRFFSQAQARRAAPVAVIGQEVKQKFFAREEALGRRIKCGRLWLRVIGVLEERAIGDEEAQDLGLRNYNRDIYTPIKTMLLRFKDRARVTPQDIERSDDENAERANYHQLDRLVVRVNDSEQMGAVAGVVERMLKRRHQQVDDYRVIVPEQLLAQERRTQRIFNIVLAAIASISLIVGGIGIMNIMLASVMERVPEIGLRRSMGATSRDVTLQFLIEALTLSLTGGLVGVALGVGLSLGIEAATGVATIVSMQAVLLSFAVSAGVGLVFGLWPARRAAALSPVEALRHQ